MNRIITALFLAFVLAGCSGFKPPQVPVETIKDSVFQLRVWVEDARFWYKKCAPESVFADVENLLSKVEGNLDDAEKLRESGSLAEAGFAVASAHATAADAVVKFKAIKSRCVE